MGLVLRPYLKKQRALVEGFLREHFQRRRIKPPRLKEAMLWSLFAGGKRLRPILALSAWEALGGEPREILPQASALELIHTYSLIHDDLPAMDDDDLRRGRPTCHRVYGEAMAILAGDGLLSEAFRLLSTPARGIPKGRLLRAVADVAERAGLKGMVAGQAQDILSEGSPRRPSEELSFIHRHKTAELITASVRMPAILAGRALRPLTRYGRCIGLAFQIVDDLLDVEGDTQELGKTAGADEQRGKLTWPALYGLEASRRRARELLQEALKALEPLGRGAEPLRAIASYIVERRS
jgi:geranylgeranyl diphosphate synthase type II